MAVKEELKAFYADPTLAPAEKAWAMSCGGPGAGTWLLPAIHPTHVFPDGQFTHAVSLRIGADILRTAKTDELIRQHTLRCTFERRGGGICGAHVDPKGHHLLGDSFGGGLCARRGDFKTALAGLITDEGYVTALEHHLTSANGQLIGRADVSWTSSNLTGLHVDVSVVMPTSMSAIARGSAVKKWRQRRWKKRR